jgi:hypothetical protein
MSNLEEAQARYNQMTAEIKKAVAGKLDGVEQQYGIAYQQLVAAGGAQKLRKKYRVR